MSLCWGTEKKGEGRELVWDSRDGTQYEGRERQNNGNALSSLFTAWPESSSCVHPFGPLPRRVSCPSARADEVTCRPPLWQSIWFVGIIVIGIDYHYGRMLNGIMQTCILNLCIGLIQGSRIDNWGHLGGGIAGAVVAYLTGPNLVRVGFRIRDEPLIPVFRPAS